MNDKETQKIVQEAKDIKDLLNHPGWGVVRSKLDARMLTLVNIESLDSKSPEDLAIEIKARQYASRILLQFLRDDVIGTASQVEFHKPLTLNREEVIFREEDR